MKNYAIGLFLLLTLFLSSCKKDDFSDDGISESFEISPTNYDDAYVINVFYPGETFPTDPVPTLYLLDGFWYRKDFTKVYLDLLENNEVPKCLIVSLSYKNKKGPEREARYKDLTYPAWEDNISGNGMKFHDFMTQQLVPEIENRYACDTTQRTLLGHSLGGYFSLFSIFNYADSIPLTFKNYVAASSTIMWGPDNYLFGLEENTAQHINSLPVNLYIATGSLEGIETNILIEEFYNRIASHNYQGLNVNFERFPTSHGSNAMPSFKQGLKYVFSH